MRTEEAVYRAMRRRDRRRSRNALLLLGVVVLVFVVANTAEVWGPPLDRVIGAGAFAPPPTVAR